MKTLEQLKDDQIRIDNLHFKIALQHAEIEETQRLLAEHMDKYEKIFWEDCPNCGAELIVTTACDPKNDKDGKIWFCDGDDVRCANNCGFISAMSADEDSIMVQDGNIDELD